MLLNLFSFHHFNKFQGKKMKNLVVLYFMIISLISSSLGKCPEDPFDCLIRTEIQENKLDIDSGELTKASNEAPLSGPEVDLSVDGRFSLNDTQPIGCGEDQTSTEGGKNCKKCSVCPKNGLLLRKCNSSQDTQCVCGKGSYLNVMNYECKACSSCPHGFGVWRQCNRNRNTVCRKCPPGTYSGVLSGTLGCILCSTCRSDQVMLQECSRIQDTVCVDKSISERNYFGPSKNVIGSEEEVHTSVSREDSQPKYHHDSSSLIIYFSFLIIIVFGLLIHVLLKWRLGKKLRKTSLPVINTNSPNHHQRHVHNNINKNGHIHLQYYNHHLNKYNNFELRPFILAKDCLKCSYETKSNLIIRA